MCLEGSWKRLHLHPSRKGESTCARSQDGRGSVEAQRQQRARTFRRDGGDGGPRGAGRLRTARRCLPAAGMWARYHWRHQVASPHASSLVQTPLCF